MTDKTLSTICQDKIQNLILDCQIMPNEKIKGDYLKSYLEVGLSPIREALSRLIATGLVELIDNVGFKVASISRDKIWDFYVSYAQIEQILFIESIESHTEAWESEVVSSLYQLAKIENNRDKVPYHIWSKLNERFHDALVSGSKLNELKSIFKQLAVRKTWYHNLAYGVDNAKLVSVNHREHSQIAQLALIGNKEVATKILHKHTMHNFELVLNYLYKRNYTNFND